MVTILEAQRKVFKGPIMNYNSILWPFCSTLTSAANVEFDLSNYLKMVNERDWNVFVGTNVSLNDLVKLKRFHLFIMNWKNEN